MLTNLEEILFSAAILILAYAFMAFAYKKGW